MKLSTVHVKEFRSVWDSNEFTVGKITCLVGKNEAGKTAILHALYRLNPIVQSDAEFNVTYDYPKAEVENYQQDIESERKKHTKAISAKFELEPPELEAVASAYGPEALTEPVVTVSKGYAKSDSKN